MSASRIDWEAHEITPPGWRDRKASIRAEVKAAVPDANFYEGHRNRSFRAIRDRLSADGVIEDTIDVPVLRVKDYGLPSVSIEQVTATEDIIRRLKNFEGSWLSRNPS